MPGLFSRIKTWSSTEDVIFSDLNAEFDNILNNFVPLMMDDYSTNVTQMRVQTDPGEIGTESLATTLAGEIERLRLIISQITGKTYWYESPSASLVDLANAVGTGIQPNRISTCRVRSGSQQPLFLVPNGVARTVKVDGTPTAFVYYINGVQYTISTDLVSTTLTAAPSTNNTALVNSSVLSGQFWTKCLGEEGTHIPIDTIGTQISALAGQIAGFKVGAEYFIATVGTDKLYNARRGFFFDSIDAPLPRVALTDNNTITLMKLTWIFATITGTIVPTYTNLTYGKDEPQSPAVNDYWFDSDNNTWKKYDGASFVSADATLVGICLQDTTATVAARSFEQFIAFGVLNTIDVLFESNTAVKTKETGARISAWGTNLLHAWGHLNWDITLNLDTGVSETSNTLYYLYVTEEGDRIISDVKPYDRRIDLDGYYHPHQSWRSVGLFFNNGSSNVSDVVSFRGLNSALPLGSESSAARFLSLGEELNSLDASSGVFSIYLPSTALAGRNGRLRIKKIGTDSNVVTLVPFGSDTIENETSQTISAPGTYLELIGDGTSNWNVI